MSGWTNQQYLQNEQYKDASNLEARMRLHQRFSTESYPWHRWVFDHIDVPANARVLELGCGPAKLWTENADRIPRTWEVTLSDFSEGMLAEAKRNVGDLDHTFFRQFDAQDIPFDDATFHAVIANHMLYHVPDIPKALVEVRRVLKPGGRLYAATNGVGHLKELKSLEAQFLGSDLEHGFREALGSRPFSLQNGAALLEPSFPNITLHRFESDLEVTEIEPLVAYLLSMNVSKVVKDVDEAAFEEKVEALREYLAGRLEAEGSIHIGKETGLFEAS